MDKEDTLSWRERSDLVIEAGIGSIPYIGGALQTLYFGSKNEKRFKRIEQFYEELKIELETIQLPLPDPDNIKNKDEFLSLLESINDEVEKAISQTKVNNYKKAYKNLLLNSHNSSLENEDFFIQILPNLTELEIKFLKIFYLARNNAHDAQKLDQSIKCSKELRLGSLNRLSNYGLLSKSLKGLSIGGNNSGEDTEYSLNNLGLSFIYFIFH